MSTISPLLFSVVMACSDTEKETPKASVNKSEKPNLITTSFPVDYLTRRLLADSATITCINPIGEDPPEYNPPAEIIADLDKADLIIQNGAGFEKWMETASIPSAKLVNSAKGITLITLEGDTHSHGKKGSHSHAGIDPHIWSDPSRYAKQAETIAGSLIAISPDNKDSISQELQSFKNELSTLKVELSAATKALRNLRMSANHPAFNYLGEATELTIHSFDFDPETAPNESEITEWLRWKEHSRGSILLWESQPNEKVASAFNGAKHINLDPLEQPIDGKDYDYVKQMTENIATLKGLSQKFSTDLEQDQNANKPSNKPQ